MNCRQLIVYQSQTDFIQNIIKSQNNCFDIFLSETTDDNMYYKNIYKSTPHGNMQYPTEKHSNYKEYTHWLNQSYYYQLIIPPLFYSN